MLLTWQPYERQEWLRTFRTILADRRDLPEPSADDPGPFALSDPARVHAVLGKAGLTNVGMDEVAEPMYFGPDPDDAGRFIGGQFAELLRGQDVDTQNRVTHRLRDDMAAHCTDRGVRYGSAAWLITAQRP